MFLSDVTISVAIYQSRSFIVKEGEIKYSLVLFFALVRMANRGESGQIRRRPKGPAHRSSTSGNDPAVLLRDSFQGENGVPTAVTKFKWD